MHRSGCETTSPVNIRALKGGLRAARSFRLSPRFGVATSNIYCYLIETAQGKQNINESISGFVNLIYLFRRVVFPGISFTNTCFHSE